jgi:hypothetical protein
MNQTQTSHTYGIAPISDNRWARITAIDHHTGPRASSIRIASRVLDTEIVRNDCASVGPGGIHIG